MTTNPEAERIKSFKRDDIAQQIEPWDKWGPYVSERGWGTVREDYSADGDAWNYFVHDHARMRTYRRAEDAIAGISDRYQILLFAPVFWNGADPILKERLFGLNPYEGNHGEDVKELYYHLDATPTHSYLKYLYKYPQSPFPYSQLVEENQKRGKNESEFELIDTGVFDKNRYFDIFIEYAKGDIDDICIKIEAINRGPDPAPLYILPQLWFRNTWTWKEEEKQSKFISVESEDPICLVTANQSFSVPKYLLFDYLLDPMYLYAPSQGTPLFTDNNSNQEVLWDVPNETAYVRDAFHRYLIQKEKDAINPDQTGTKAAIKYYFPSIKPNEKAVLHLRLTNRKMDHALRDVEKIIQERKKEADLYYASIHPPQASEEEKKIQRQALAGMIWNKQIYIFNVASWLKGDSNSLPPESHQWIRNIHWRHITSYRIFSMPDKWEYPWFAAWDLAFHAISFSLIDLDFAKHQLWLLLFDQFQHPNGSIPAYEWEFSDVNPPVQAWAALKIFDQEKKKTGVEDFSFLEKCFHRLILNFAWWINRVDAFGNNVFEGGFLGMDNVAVTDRSVKLPPGFLLDQADGAGWVSLFCLNLTRMALRLAKNNPIYESLAIKFFQHFVYVSAAMRKGDVRHYDLWDEQDAFFYSFLRFPDGHVEEHPVRSLVGIIPFFACDTWDDDEIRQFPNFYKAFNWMVEKRVDITSKCVHVIQSEGKIRYVFGLLNPDQIARFLKYIWDPNEFRSEYGLRSLSKYHEDNPAQMHGFSLHYEPGEAVVVIKGGNSNWRGPIWFPLNYFLIETLSRLGKVYKNNIKVKVSGEAPVTLTEMAHSFTQRLLNLFKKTPQGTRPYLGDIEKFQKDPHFRDHLLFYEHFHGDTGRGLGASHQTGWTGLIANLIDEMH